MFSDQKLPGARRCSPWIRLCHDHFSLHYCSSRGFGRSLFPFQIIRCLWKWWCLLGLWRISSLYVSRWLRHSGVFTHAHPPINFWLIYLSCTCNPFLIKSKVNSDFQSVLILWFLFLFERRKKLQVTIIADVKRTGQGSTAQTMIPRKVLIIYSAMHPP